MGAVARWRGGGGRAYACAVAVAALVVIQAEPSLALGDSNKRNLCTPIIDLDVQQAAEQSTPSLTSFPVFVHYMKDTREASGTGSVAQVMFNKDQIKEFFAEEGDFNKVWWAGQRKIKFVLVGVDVCPFDPVEPDAGLGSIPAKPNVMRRFGDNYNVRQYGSPAALKPFRGLDLYLWPQIDDPVGGAPVGGFARSSAAMKRPSVWLGPVCVRDVAKACVSMFAHEVAHFFGLCHVCTQQSGGGNPATCQQTCPLSARPGPLKTCDPDDPDKSALMADNGGVKLEPCEVTFAVGKALGVLAGAGH